MDGNQVVDVVTAVVTLASVLANVVPGHTVVGKALRWLALNWRSSGSQTGGR